jgi:cation:H+ antiporter
MAAWVIFALSGVAVVLAGIRLTQSGEVIAEETGLGGAWVGAVFIAIATSLPELATDFSAVRQGEHDLVIGDLFGSSMANMLILALLDLFLWRQRVLTRVAVNQALVGLLGISVTALAVAGVVTDLDLTFLGIGWAPLLIAGTYLVGVRLLHHNRAEPPFEASPAGHDPHSFGALRRSPAFRRSILEFFGATAVILLTAPFLARSAAGIAAELGVATGVIGIILLALTTSLPEVTVTVVALRGGSIDMAVGNLLGSNCINMMLFLFLDMAHGPGSLLREASTSALIAGVFAILLMAQTSFEILNKAERRVHLLEPDALFRIATYALGIYLVVRAGA